MMAILFVSRFMIGWVRKGAVLIRHSTPLLEEDII
jgi:hypothetical protein